MCGCAGGATFDADYPMIDAAFDGGNVYGIRLTGLTGGHSGQEIHKNRGNANQLICQILQMIAKKEDRIGLISLNGGEKENAIPVWAEAILRTDRAYDDFYDLCIDAVKEVMAPFKDTDPEAVVDVFEAKETSGKTYALQPAVSLILSLPNGVMAMEKDRKEQVETSLNLGVMCTQEGHLHLQYCVRSSVDEKKEDLLTDMEKICEEHGAFAEISGMYPGWQYQKDSAMQSRLLRVYRELYGKDMITETIHAGVECGFFVEKIPGLDCVSIGPDMRDIHTTRETLSVASVSRTWDFICAILALKEA